jgi:hypothetical protein
MTSQPDLAPKCGGPVGERAPKDPGLAAAKWEEPCQESKQRSLPGTICSKENQDLSSLEVEVNP